MAEVPFEIEALHAMKNYPKELTYSGDLKLLKRPKVSIVGSRKPSAYAKQITFQLAHSLAKIGICIVSGGAMGIDALAHNGAGTGNTIAVLPCGVDIKYPAVNTKLLSGIEKEGLLLSQFHNTFKATPWSFVARNELVVALGDLLIVTEAQAQSGSMRSIEFAKKMGKEIFVLPHRVGESGGTNLLLSRGEAKAIYDIESFVKELSIRFGLEEKLTSHKTEDPFLLFCKTIPSYEEALAKFPTRVFEAELSGEIIIKNAKVYLT